MRHLATATLALSLSAMPCQAEANLTTLIRNLSVAMIVCPGMHLLPEVQQKQDELEKTAMRELNLARDAVDSWGTDQQMWKKVRLLRADENELSIFCYHQINFLFRPDRYRQEN